MFRPIGAKVLLGDHTAGAAGAAVTVAGTTGSDRGFTTGAAVAVGTAVGAISRSSVSAMPAEGVTAERREPKRLPSGFR